MDNEIAEAALNAMEHMIRRCPFEASPSVKGVYDLVSSTITYDPNYQPDEDADMQDADGEDFGDWGSDGDMDNAGED